MEEAMQFLAATEAQGERVDLKEAAVHVESHRSNVWRELKKLQTSGAWTELQGGAAKGSKGCGELLRLSEVDIRSDMIVSTCWAALGVGPAQTDFPEFFGEISTLVRILLSGKFPGKKHPRADAISGNSGK